MGWLLSRLFRQSGVAHRVRGPSPGRHSAMVAVRAARLLILASSNPKDPLLYLASPPSSRLTPTTSSFRSGRAFRRSTREPVGLPPCAELLAQPGPYGKPSVWTGRRISSRSSHYWQYFTGVQPRGVRFAGCSALSPDRVSGLYPAQRTPRRVRRARHDLHPHRRAGLVSQFQVWLLDVPGAGRHHQ